MVTRRLVLMLGLAGSVTSLGMGCAQEVGDIDRTQPNKIEKSAFDGEWYMMHTVVGVNSTGTSAFQGLQGELNRVRFEITREYLLAKKTHEDVLGATSSSDGQPDGADAFLAGSNVAAYPVSHFDVIRSYNASTGEQSNVIFEDSSDRPWYEREWMRVQFSSNRDDAELTGLVPTKAAMLSIAADDGFANEHQTGWNIERDEDGQVVYIDIETRYILQSDFLSCVFAFGFPLYGGWCGNEEVTVRTSFAKITEESDYIPREYSDYDMNRFGFFRTERATYDRLYGSRDSGRIDLANRWNLWERHFDDAGNELPYAQRTPKPITYYLTTNFPFDLVDESFEIANQYDYAFRRTVAALQGKQPSEVDRMFYLCLNPGGTDLEPPAELLGDVFDEKQKQTTRDAYASSNEGYQKGYCKKPGDEKKLGDVRFAFFSWINQKQAGPLGYGPSGADPLTGQIVQASANIYGEALDTLSQYLVDMSALVTDDKSAAEISAGEDIKAYFRRMREKKGFYFGLTGDKSNGPSEATVNDIHQRVASLANTAEVRESVKQSTRYQQVMAMGTEALRLKDYTQINRLEKARGTFIEDKALVPELVQGLGFRIEDNRIEQIKAGDPLSEELKDMISPIRMASIRAFNRKFEELQRDWLGRNIHMATDFDPKLVHFARDLARIRQAATVKYGDDVDAINRILWLEARGRLYRAVQEHEVGHTVGLRHNFEGTSDALNYFPKYWALRQKTFDPACPDETAAANRTNFSTFDPYGLQDGLVAPKSCAQQRQAAFGTRQQLLADAAYVQASAALMEELESDGLYDQQYSSIMDYQGKLNLDFMGLGLYDYAAIAYGYGDLVEVFNEAPFKVRFDATYNVPAGVTVPSDPEATVGDFASIVAARDTARVRDMRDVENLRRVMVRGTNTLKVSEDTELDLSDIYKPGNSRDYDWTFWHYSILPIMFADVNANGPSEVDIAAKGYHPKMDFTGVGRMYGMYDRSLKPRSAVGASDVLVPYRFCSDEYRGSSNVCNVYDTGADDFERLRTTLDTYDQYYIVDSFRRERAAWGLNLLPLIQRQISRSFGPALQTYQYWLIGAANYGDEWNENKYGGQSSFDAAVEALNFLANAVTTPAVGTYEFDSALGMLVNVADRDVRGQGTTPADAVVLGLEDGARYGSTQFKRNDQGERGYYGYLRYERLTHFYTKWAAMMTMMSGEVDVIGVDTSSDSSAFYIPPYLVFGDYMNNWFGSIITEDFTDIGACYTRNPDGSHLVEPIDMIRNGFPRPCSGANQTLMNPYTASFGNRDYNMQVFSVIYASAMFQDNLDARWPDQANVFIVGRGEAPDCNQYQATYEATLATDPEAAGFLPVCRTYQDVKSGLFYGALCPTNYEPGNSVPAANKVACELIESLFDYDQRFRGTQESYRLDNHIEMVRFLVESNRFFSAWNPAGNQWVLDPW